VPEPIRSICRGSIVAGLLILPWAGTGLGQAALPPGVKRVVLGDAVRAKDQARGETCTIPSPLASPARFKAGVREVSYLLEVDADLVREVKASIIGDVGSSETKGLNCNAYAFSGGAIRKTQFGGSLSRSDGQTLKSGSFTLSIEVVSTAGRAAPPLKVPFEIR